MTLDTNIIIAYLGGDPEVIAALNEWKQEGRVMFLSAVVETEVLSFSNLTLEERRRTEEFLEGLTFITFDRRIARLAAEIRSVSEIKFPDAAIAATALATHTPLITRNVRDFKKVSGLTVITI